ncbi:MAG TPA: hypothetical protein VNA25_14735, partial [Phycisphaerae bacterium]|nr:hypothetical protein [Phycisphaerae bacterium]
VSFGNIATGGIYDLVASSKPGSATLGKKGILGYPYNKVTDLGEAAGGMFGVGPVPKEQAAKREADAVAAKKAVKVAGIAEEQAGMKGQAEQLAKMRMRRGFLSTILSGGSAGSALSDMMAARKTLLGQ